MESTPLTSIFLPVVLVLVMFGVGLELRLADFVRVAARPRGIVAGVLAQIVVVPAIAFAVAFAFSLPPALTVGIVIVGSCPGGAVSNLISYLARADVALSVTLTAISSVVTVVTIPLIVNYALRVWMDGSVIEFPLLWTSLKLTGLALLPVATGMSVRHFHPDFADRSEPFVSRGSAIGLALVIAIAVASNIEELPRYLRILWAPLLLLNVCTIAAGAAAGILARSAPPVRTTLMIETGIQNGVLGITIPAVWIGSAEMAVPPAIYGVLMLISGALLIVMARVRQHQRPV